MKLHNPQADTFVPDGSDIETALARTTHLAVRRASGRHRNHGVSRDRGLFGNPDRWFTGIVVSDGAGSPRSGIYESYTDEQMKKVRIREQRKAAYVGEYSCQLQLGYPSASVKDPASRDLPS